jgi:hypothetical protein
MKIFGLKREEVTGERKKLHSKELHNLNLSPTIIRQIKSRRMEWAVHVARMREERGREKRTRFWWESQIPLGRPKRRWEDGIRMDLRETGWGSGMD